MSTLRILGLLVLLAPGFCFAQKKIPVQVVHSGNDIVGQRMVYALKERIRASRGMELINDYTRPRIVLSIVSIDNSPSNSGISSAISTAILYDSLTTRLSGAYITSYVQTCGTQKAESCAESLTAVTDAETEKLRTKHPDLWNSFFGTQPERPAAAPRSGFQPVPKPKARSPENPF